MSKAINLVGQVFGRLTVLKRVENNKHNRAMWECVCECGKIITVEGAQMRSGHTSSCGCFKIDQTRKHGMWRTPEYCAWDTMKRRCNSPQDKGYKYYGGRGITVCDEWMKSFPAFFKHIGHKPSSLHSIDRINNNGNYEPGNVRWATRQEQNNNTRHNHLVTVGEITLNVSQWAKINNIKRDTIYARIRLGWKPEKAVSFPVSPLCKIK